MLSAFFMRGLCKAVAGEFFGNVQGMVTDSLKVGEHFRKENAALVGADPCREEGQ